VHGGGGQGLDWLGTPDGRPGWARYLVEEGYAVYVVDRPGHGRSSYHPDVLGPMGPPFTYELARFLFMPPGEGTAPSDVAQLHSQWPGSGEVGDPALDQFVASAGPMMGDFAAAHALDGARGAELLDRIGPAILIANSAGGPAAWLTADARPGLVQAIVAIEVMGPPFLENPDRGLSLDWGLAASPLAYDPPVSDPSELREAGPARRLANLQGVPIAVVTGEASFLGQSDAATAGFLLQAGCDVEHLRLADHGVHGNGHLMMLERNNREALQPILDWLAARGL
jgi:pimeloyl-ACP methyl ester carboxylesterase